jgi:hypothetical protein
MYGYVAPVFWMFIEGEPVSAARFVWENDQNVPKNHPKLSPTSIGFI